MRWRNVVAALAVVGATIAWAQPALGEDRTVRDITLGEGFEGRHADVLRLYTAFFDREPDLSGTQYWMSVVDSGSSLDEIAGWFADSEEFALTYGSTNNEEFLTIVYRNVLGRTYDQGGFDYWLGQMSGGLSRGGVVRWVTASEEFINAHPYPNPVGASPGSTAAVGEAFSYVGYGGEAWAGTFDGLVSVPLSEYNDGAGRCLLVTGSLTPTAIPDGRVSSPYSTPNLGLIVDGKFIQDGVNDCDWDEALAKGHDWILHAEVTLGTDFPFIGSVFIPAASDGVISAAVIGDPRYDNAYYFDPTVVPLRQARVPAGSLAGTRVSVGTGFDYVNVGGEEWTGTVLGLVPVPASRFASATGRCFMLVGELTPTKLTSGTISSPYSTPGVGVVVAGEYHDDEVNNCDTDGAEAAGYGWILRTEVTVGTSYPFYAEVFIPDTRPGPIQALVIGDAATTGEFYAPAILPGFPS